MKKWKTSRITPRKVVLLKTLPSFVSKTLQIIPPEAEVTVISYIHDPYGRDWVEITYDDGRMTHWGFILEEFLEENDGT